MPIPRLGQEMQLATASVQVLIQDVERMCEVAQAQVAPFLHEVRFVLSRFVLSADKLCFCPRERPVILSKPTNKDKPHRAVHDWS